MPDAKTGAPTVGELLPPIGHNNPPEPTPFEAVKQEIEDLYLEASHWLDGEPIANGEQAVAIAELKKRITAADKRAEEMRVAEKKPHDDAAKAVQDKFNPLIQKGRGKTALAIDAANKALAPWLAELDRQQREVAREAQERAAAAAAAAQEASRAAAASASLAAREEAERLQNEAKEQAKTARAAETAKPQVHATGGGRAIGMKTVWEAELVDPVAAIEHYRSVPHGAAALKECMKAEAKRDVAGGVRHIPGFKITSRSVAV